MAILERQEGFGGRGAKYEAIGGGGHLRLNRISIPPSEIHNLQSQSAIDCRIARGASSSCG